MTPGPGIMRTVLPKGFTASGVNCGVRKYRPDLGIIISDRDAVAAGVYTKNECQAACIVYSKDLTPSTKIRAIVTNSGQANAATGGAGIEDNFRMAASAAKALGCETEQILTASTGMIGVRLEVEKIERAMPELVSRATDIGESFALAILTTDLVPKTVSTTVELSTGCVRITGICKGSGMIHPNMGTMLGYFLTDALITPDLAHKLLGEVTDVSFNMISVDGETSTNDCAFFLANGASQARLTEASDILIFKEALTQVAKVLAQAIARDGEGATKLIEVTLNGAPSDAIAKQAARGVIVSPLVKSAMHGEDPNWGRILARLGAEGVPSHALTKMELTIQGTKVLSYGQPVSFDAEDLRKRLKSDTIQVVIELASGSASATAWGCDLSKKYVEINAEYST